MPRGAHMAELGVVAGAKDGEGLKKSLAVIPDGPDERSPVDASASLIVLAQLFGRWQTMIASIEKRLLAEHRANAASKPTGEHPQDRHHWREAPSWSWRPT